MKHIISLLLTLVVCMTAGAVELTPVVYAGGLAVNYLVTPGTAFIVCGEISTGIGFDCDFPLVSGVKDRLILMNYDDIDGITRDGGNPQIITDLTLAVGALGYEYEGKNNSNEPRSALVKQRYAEVYDHEVIFKGFDNNPTVKQELESMAKGRIVAVIQNNHIGTGGNAGFEIYGLDVGMTVQELERVLNDADTQGAYNIILRSPDESKEPHLPSTFFDTDFATTKAKVDALLV